MANVPCQQVSSAGLDGGQQDGHIFFGKRNALRKCPLAGIKQDGASPSVYSDVFSDPRRKD